VYLVIVGLITLSDTHTRTHTHAHTHTHDRTPLDEESARRGFRYLYNKHRRQISTKNTSQRVASNPCLRLRSHL